MIISYKYKFIFIKTRKTAGSSITTYLNTLLGNEDISDGDRIDGRLSKNVNYQDHRNGHQTAAWISKAFPHEWNNFYKFTVERNSWGKVLSAFNFYKKNNLFKFNTIHEFLHTHDERKSIPVDWKSYTIKNQIAVDDIIQYDNLENDFLKICKKIGISYNGELQKIKIKHYGSDHYKYQFSSTEHKKIKSLFYKEIDFFNYKYDTSNLSNLIL
jgi:hypothetical protein